MSTFTIFTILTLFFPFYTSAFLLPEYKYSIDQFEYEFADLNKFDYNIRVDTNINLKTTENTTIDLLLSSDSLNPKFPKNKTLNLLITICVVSCFPLVVNIRVFYIVLLTSKRKSRPANILVAHSSFVVIILTILYYIDILVKSEIFHLSVPGFCKVFALLKNGFYYVLPVNTVVIVWVRVRDNAVILRKSAAYRVIGVTWAITLFCNLPSLWKVEYVSSSKSNMGGECRKLDLLGSFGATIAYNVFRLFVFNVLVSFYLIRAAIKLRSAIRFLQANKLISKKRVARRTKGARLVYFQTILFIVYWLPLGFGVFLYQLFSHSSSKDSYVRYFTPFAILYSNVIILSPLSYVYLVEKISIGEIIVQCFCAKRKPNLLVNQATIRQDDPEAQEGIQNNTQLKSNSDIRDKRKSATLPTGSRIKKKSCNEFFVTSEMSRISTFGVTEVEVHSKPNEANKENEIVPYKRDSETLV